MSYPILYEANATDFFNNGLGTLPDAISSLVTEERNGEFVLDMTYPLHGIRANQLKNNRIIKVDAGHKLTDQRFVIKTVTPAMDNSGNTIITVHAEHISYLSNDLAIQPQLSMTDMTAEQALNFWNRNLTTPNQFTVDSDITTHNGTTWSIDKVQTARQALGGVEGSILDVWGGEYRFDNLHISLLSKRGTVSNTLLAYGRNITSFEQEQNIMDTYTSVYPYFIQKGDKDEQDTIYTIDNYVVDSANANKFPNKKPLPLDLSSELGEIKVGTKPSDASADDKTEYISVATLKSRMKTYAQQYIKNNNIGVPKISIKISFVDLSKTANYADVAPLEQLDLCDNVPIKFPDLDIDTTAKVSRVVWNVLTDSYDSLELGDISATLGDKIAEIDQKANKAKETADNIVQVGADGKSTVFRGQDTPTANHIGDLWYKPNGEDTEMYQWDGVSWHFVMSTKDTHDISDKVDQAMQEMADKEKEINGKLESNQIDISQAQKDLEQVKQDTANQLADIRDSVVKDVADAKAQSKDALDKANGVDDKASQALENATEAKETATTVATDMDTVKGEISSKADKSTVDTINQTVSDQGTKITQNANDIKSKASSSDVDKLSGRVSTAETTLLQTAQGLTGKADSSQLNKLSNSLTTLSNNFSTTSSGFQASLSKIDDKVNSNKEETDSALQVAKGDIKATTDNLSTNYTRTTDMQSWTNSQIKQSADEINSTVTSVSNKVDNFQIGGRNLLLDTDFNNLDLWFANQSWTKQPDKYNGLAVMETTGDWNGLSQYVKVKTGEVYTFSLYARYTSGTGNSYIYWLLNSDPESGHARAQVSATNKQVNLSENWQRISAITTIKADGYIRPRLERSNNNDNILQIAGMKLEKGTIATDYSPAPEDMATVTALSKVDQKADSISTTVANNKKDADSKFTNVNQTISGIQSTVASKADASQITQLSNQINLKVSQTDFDNLQVGGRNYVHNGNFTDGTNGWTRFGDIDTYQIWGDGRLVYASTKALNGFTGAGQNNIPISGSKGDSITVSFDACYFGNNPSNYAKNINVIIHFNDNSGTIVGQETNSIDMTFSVQRYSFTVKAQTNFSTVNVRFVYNANTLYKNKLGRVKVEAGTKATDYSDSPDDKADKANLVSQINIDKSGVLIQGKKIMIDGDATIKNAVIKSSMIDTLDASKITAGILNAANVNIINMNANNITTGTLKGTNLSMNLTTGEVLFQKGSIKSTNGKLNISVDDGTMAVANSQGSGALFKDGKIFMADNSGLQKFLAGDTSVTQYGVIERGMGGWLDNPGAGAGITVHGTNDGIGLYQNENGKNLQFMPYDTSFRMGGQFNNGSGLIVHKYNTYLNGEDNKGRVYINGGTHISDSGLVFSGSQAGIMVGIGSKNSNGTYTPDSNTTGNNTSIFGATVYLNYARLNLKSDTFYSGDTDWYLRNYDGDFATVRGKNFVNSSQLSKKTDIKQLDVDKVRNAIRNVDIREYRYKSDIKNGEDKVYASAIIDDVNDTPQYNIPFDWISADGTGRDDGTATGYLVVTAQDLYNKIDELESEIKKLEGE